MKRISLLLITLLIALLTPLAINAQTQNLTVHDGKENNIYIPIFGYYADVEQITEFIIPASELSSMQNMSITGIKLYTNYDLTFDGTFTLSLEEVASTTYDELSLLQSEAINEVYSGTISINNQELMIDFDALYTYNGGNLLVSFYTEGCNNYAPSSNYGFYGEGEEVVTNSSVFVFNNNGQYQGMIQSFIPKTTFYYEVPSDCPKPTNLSANNITPYSASLGWTANGKEESWEIAYSTEEGFDPDRAENIIRVDKNPYTLQDLRESTTYFAYIRSDCHSNWSNMVTFTTPSSCEAPFNVNVADITYHSANISWEGWQDSYTIRIKPISFFEEFENGIPGTWTIIDADNDGDNWSTFTPTTIIDAQGNPTVFGATCATSASYNSNGALTPDNWLITPQIDIKGTLRVWLRGQDPSFAAEHFAIYLSLGGNTISDFTTTLVAETVATGEYVEFTADLNSYAGNNDQKGYIAIRHFNCTDMFRLNVDNLMIVSDAEWETINNVTSPYAFEELVEETPYMVQIQGTCNAGQTDWSEIVFTSSTGNVFQTDGNWNVASNWKNNAVPAESEDVTIKANCTIPSDYIANAGNITISENGSLTIQDGGQLIHTNEGVVATMEKEITGYTGEKDGYYLIASPANTVFTYNGNTYTYTDPAEVENMLTGEYDLYGFDCTEDLEWRNYEADPDNFVMWQGKGYLYANSAEKTILRFTGELHPFVSDYANDGYLLSYEASDENFNGFNLVGNMLAADAYIVIADYESGITGLAEDVYFYTMGDGELVAGTGAVAPMQGVMVQASSDSQVALCFTEALRSNKALNISLSNSHGLLDAAYVRFNEGNELNKFQLNPNHTKLFFTKENEDFAVVRAENQGELPVSFKAEKNGTYTLSFSNENVTFGYLHLIDNMTGADVDLLANPSYRFEAKTTDYASRFKIVFSTENASSDHFAYFSDGALVINNEGNATMNVYDVTGRLVDTQSVNGSCQVGFNAVPGVYMIQLINGNDVKTQKIVVK